MAMEFWYLVHLCFPRSSNHVIHIHDVSYYDPKHWILSNRYVQYRPSNLLSLLLISLSFPYSMISILPSFLNNFIFFHFTSMFTPKHTTMLSLFAPFLDLVTRVCKLGLPLDHFRLVLKAVGLPRIIHSFRFALLSLINRVMFIPCCYFILYIRLTVELER